MEEYSGTSVKQVNVHSLRSDWKVKETFKELPKGVGKWISVRFCMAYLSFIGILNFYILRVNLSVAILSMVNSSYDIDTHNKTGSDYCPAPTNHKNTTGGEFDWDADEKGLILGAFFYGYVVTQFPGGLLASKYGGKWLFGGGIFGTAVLTLVTPIAARTSFKLLVAVRVCEGIIGGAAFPAQQAIWGDWAPPVERSQLVSISYSGCSFGTVVAMLLSGLLCSSDILGGWPSVFYIFGVVTIVWCLVWFVFASNSPSEHRLISQQEVQYIQDSIGQRSTNHPVPWSSIFTSKEVWAICIAGFAGNWSDYTLLTSLPLYLHDVLHYDITQDAFLASLPYIVVWVFSIAFSILADTIRKRGILNTTQTRKVFSSVGFLGIAVFLVSAGYIGCNQALAVSFICISKVFSSFANAGLDPNPLDLSFRYSGILMGISNTVGSIPGFVAPQVAGALTEHQSGRTQWLYVFYVTAGVSLLGGLLFALLGSGVEQEWNKVSTVKDKTDTKPLLDENSAVNIADNSEILNKQQSAIES